MRLLFCYRICPNIYTFYAKLAEFNGVNIYLMERRGILKWTAITLSCCRRRKKTVRFTYKKKPERQWHISGCFIVEDEILEVFRYSVALECSEWIQNRVYSICCSSTFWAYPKKWSFQQTKRVIHICNGFILQYITSFVRSWALLNTKRLKELIELPSQSPRAMFVAFVWLVSLWPIFTILHTVFSSYASLQSIAMNFMPSYLWPSNDWKI